MTRRVQKEWDRVQKEWEHYHLDRFVSLWSHFPPGTPTFENPPAPDVLLCLPDRKIGIELTRFLRDGAGASGSPRRALHELRNKVVERAKKKWESRKLPPVGTSLIWDEHQNISRQDVEALAEHLVDLVMRNIPDVDGHFTVTYPEPGWKDLPKCVAVVFISRPAYLNESIWCFSQGGSVPHLRDVFGRLQSIVDKKEPKVSGYRSCCKEVWLLIVADGINIESFVVIDNDEHEHEQVLVSSFDRAFFLSAMHGKVIELTLTKEQPNNALQPTPKNGVVELGYWLS